MANYDSSLTGAQIESALTAVNGLISASNNGKVIVVENGALAAKSASEIEIGTIEALSVTANGTYTHSGEGGYNPVTVNVAAVVQALSVTENGLYAPPSGVDGYNSITVNVSGGGSQRPYAFLYVTFPSDATSCTITNGSETITATTGSPYMFYVPSAGTWTVTVSKTGETKSTTVSITTTGVCHVVTVSFNVPSGYREVEYLESTGTQYIKTGVTYSSTSYFNIEWQYYGTPTNNTWFYGAWVSYKDSIAGYYNGTVRFLIGGQGNSNLTLDTSKHIYEANSSSLMLDGSSIGTPDWSNVPSQEIYLFRDNGHSNATEGRLYSCKIYDSSTLIRDFVPCYNETTLVPYLYDKVNDVFYANDGTGVFTTGPDVT